MSAKSQLTESAGPARMLRPVAISVLLGAIVSVVILVLLSIVLSSRSVPQSMINPMASFAMSVGAFISGFCCSKVMRKSGLMCGLVCGFIFSVVILACSVVVPDNGLGLGALIKTMLMLFSAMIGGVIGVNTGKRRK